MSNKSAADGRRSTRLPISLPIVIHGKDAQQEAFRESTHTLIVNQHGAKLATTHQLLLGAEVLIENTTLGSVAKANVVWVSPKYSPHGRNEVGVQLVEAQNIWGIEFPPNDWTTKGKDQEAPAAEAAPAPPPAAAKIPPPSTPPASPASEAGTTPFPQELHESMESYARQFRQRLDEVVQQVGRQSEMDLRERAAAAIGQELAPIEQHVLASSERLSTLKAEVRDFEARLAESQRNWYAAQENVPPPLSPEQIREKIEADAVPALQMIAESAIAAARERLQAQLQADAGQALAAWRSNLQVERDGLVEEARQQIVMALTSAVEELDRERDAGFDGMKRRIQEHQENAALQFQTQFLRTVEDQSESLQALLDKTSAEIAERQANLLQTQLDALLVNRLDQAQRQAQSVGKDLQTSFEDGLRAAGEKSSRGLQAHLQEIADKTAASSSDQVRKQLEESANAAADKSLEVWQSRLQEIANQTVASSSDRIRAQVEASANAAADKSLEVWQSRLQEIANQTVVSSADQIRAQVESSANAAADKSLQVWQSRLQEIADQTVASSSDQIRAQVEASGNAAADKSLEVWQSRLQEIADQTVASSSDHIRAQVEASANAAADKSLEVWQSRLQEIADQTVASSSDHIRAQVEQSAQTSADKTLQAWQAKLQEVADHAAASSEDQVQRKISEALILLGPKLQDMQERAVNDAVAAFRGRLSQLLGLLPAGGSK
jgi:hypothetical protein